MPVGKELPGPQIAGIEDIGGTVYPAKANRSRRSFAPPRKILCRFSYICWNLTFLGLLAILK